MPRFCWTERMRLQAVPSPKAGNQLWGIYSTDRACGGKQATPIRTIIEAPTQRAAEEEAARLGFGHTCARQLRVDQFPEVRWLPMHRLAHESPPSV